MEALDILAGLGVVGTPENRDRLGFGIVFCPTTLPENMLHHVKVGRDIFKMSRLMMVQHLVHEVDVPEVVAGPRIKLNGVG